MYKQNIVLLAYGNEIEYRRAIFCLWSFHAWAGKNSSRVIIYTDHADYFKTYLDSPLIQYVTLGPTQLDGFLGDTDYIHRRKIAVIDLTFKAFPEEDIVFLDSDTFILKNPESLLKNLSAQHSIMYEREYTLEGGLRLFNSFNQGNYPSSFIRYISGRDFLIQGQIERFDEKDSCWNSGVLGLSRHFASYLPDIYTLTDAFYTASKWFISEQLAFSLILQRKTTILPAKPYIIHYWGKRQKALVDQMLINILTDYHPNSPEQTEQIRKLTNNIRNLIETDILFEQFEIALTQRRRGYAFKKCIQLVIKNPFRLSQYKKLIRLLTSPR